MISKFGKKFKDISKLDLAPPKTRKQKHPAKHGKYLSIEDDFSLSDEKIGDYFLGVHRVLSNLFGEREVLAFVTSTRHTI